MYVECSKLNAFLDQNCVLANLFINKNGSFIKYNFSKSRYEIEDLCNKVFEICNKLFKNKIFTTLDEENFINFQFHIVLLQS